LLAIYIKDLTNIAYVLYNRRGPPPILLLYYYWRPRAESKGDQGGRGHTN